MSVMLEERETTASCILWMGFCILVPSSTEGLEGGVVTYAKRNAAGDRDKVSSPEAAKSLHIIKQSTPRSYLFFVNGVNTIL